MSSTLFCTIWQVQQPPAGKNAEREELWKALDYLREGDTLVVPSLDRLGRSIQDLIAIVSGLGKRGIGFTSLHEALDTTTPGGRLPELKGSRLALAEATNTPELPQPARSED
ncbi:recombinase family protein [Streptomyces cyslabdanicus]|uniref:recombinase family protein n=1 Tax=Streptomyces cyslabdanicus TaxID=1470456 RepID=UPI004044C48E